MAYFCTMSKYLTTMYASAVVVGSVAVGNSNTLEATGMLGPILIGIDVAVMITSVVMALFILFIIKTKVTTVEKTSVLGVVVVVEGKLNKKKVHVGGGGAGSQKKEVLADKKEKKSEGVVAVAGNNNSNNPTKKATEKSENAGETRISKKTVVPKSLNGNDVQSAPELLFQDVALESTPEREPRNRT